MFGRVGRLATEEVVLHLIKAKGKMFACPVIRIRGVPSERFRHAVIGIYSETFDDNTVLYL